MTFNFVDGTPVRDYMIIKAYKVGSDFSKLKESVKGVENAKSIGNTALMAIAIKTPKTPAIGSTSPDA